MRDRNALGFFEEAANDVEYRISLDRGLSGSGANHIRRTAIRGATAVISFLYRSLAVIFTLIVGFVLLIEAQVSGPSFGYLFDADSGKLCPLQGILGSATFGTPEDSQSELSGALMLDSNHFIVSSAESPQLLLLRPGGPSRVAAVIQELPGNPTMAVSSIQGTAAAFYYAGLHSIKVLTGLPNQPSVAHSIDLADSSGTIRRMALSKNGELLLYSAVEGSEDAIYGWSADTGQSRFLTSIGATGGLAIGDTGDGYVADERNNAIFAIRNLAGGGSPQFVAGEGEGISRPVGLAVSASNELLVANATTGDVSILDSSGHYVNTVTCGCRPNELTPFRESTFLLTSDVHRAVFVLDLNQSPPRIVFIPPAKDRP